MINAINVASDSTKYINKYGKPLNYLSDIKRINIFIGENNSGKSRMLRSLVRDGFRVMSNSFLDNVKIRELNTIRGEIGDYVFAFNRDNKNNIQIELPYDSNNLSAIDFYIQFYELFCPDEIELQNLNANCRSYISRIQRLLHDYEEKLYQKNNNFSTITINDYSPLYIPVLRGIENFDRYFHLNRTDKFNSITMDEEQRLAVNEYKENSKHLYLNKTLRAYSMHKENVFTAEDLYDVIESKLLGKVEDRDFIKDFQDFISEKFYDGQEFTIIPNKANGCLFVKIGNNSDKALHNLGDGIKQLITILYKIYEKKSERACFFIEEPELNLHPGYQRKFIEILQSDMFPNHQYFITTHSNHLIDSCFDYQNISIYKFINVNKSNNTFQVINTKPNDVEMLQLLGVNNSSIFLSNCTIWVEGISDKILISKYLQVYMKEKGKDAYREDIHYSFVEYGGNNIVHWSFISDKEIATINASGITNRSFIICDNDNEGKRRRKENLRSIFKDDFYELTVREIENTIKKEVLEKTLFPDGNVVYRKKFEQKEYTNTKIYMGKFIDDHYKLSRNYSSSKGTGTIVNKMSFAKEVVKNINSIDDLTTQAINMCERILSFIEKSNSME